jgi:hypothetical protein
MKIVLIGKKGGRLDGGDSLFGDLPKGIECALILRQEEENISREIRAEAPNLIVTEDLEGFEMTTLAEGVFYNLLRCRQLHLLWNLKEGFEEILRSHMSLNMYFSCQNEALEESLCRLNSDLTIAKELRGLKEDSLIRRIVDWYERLPGNEQ